MGKTSDELNTGFETVDASSPYGPTETVSTDPESGDEVEAARARVENTRSRMTETVDAIEDKLHPGRVAQRAKEAVVDATVGKAQQAVTAPVDTARDMGSGLVDTVRQNPIPAALAGLGLGWLFMSARKQSDSTYRDGYAGYSPGGYYRDRPYDYQYQSPYEYSGGYGYSDTNYGNDQYGTSGGPGQVQDKVKDAASQAQSKVSDVAGRAQDTASQAVGQAQETAGQVAGQAQDVAYQAADQARYQAQRAQSGFQQMVEEQPLGVAAMALAIGAAVGLAIPETQKEHELMGETRDTLVEKAQQTAQEKVQQVQSVATEAVGAAKDTAKQEAQKQGLSE